MDTPVLNETACALVRAHLRDDEKTFAELWKALVIEHGQNAAEWLIGEACAYHPDFSALDHDVRNAVRHRLMWNHTDILTVAV